MDREAATVPSPPAGRPGAWPAWAVAWLAVGALLRCAWLTRQSLWWDEGYSLYVSGGATLADTVERLRTGLPNDRLMPLYYFVLQGWRQAFGQGEVALRALSVLCGVGSLGFLYLAARRAFGPGHALWTLALAATSSVHVYYSQEVRMYAPILLLCSAQLYAYLGAVERPEATGPRRLLGVTTALGTLTQVTVGLYGVALALADLIVPPGARGWLRRWWPTLALLVPVAAYVATVALGGGRPRADDQARPAALLRNLAFVPYGLAVGMTYGPPIDELRGAGAARALLADWPRQVALVAVLAAAAAAMVASLRRGGWPRPVTRSAARLLLAAGLSMALMAAFALATGLNWLPRHTLFVMTTLAVVAPLAARRPAPTGRDPMLVTGRIALVLLIALNLDSLTRYYFDGRHARDDYRAAARYLRDDPGARGRAVLLSGDLGLLSYYGDRGVLDARQVPWHRLAAWVEAAAGDADRVLLVVNREHYWYHKQGATGRDDLIGRGMGPAYRRESIRSFKRIKIYQFTKVKSRPDADRDRAPRAPARSASG
ncbi:MAG TPA: glycosyltransferase family 39 protein [Isosphaeraceae bacterium]|jgi:hypothetical protein|nr:glycosyltransferase family 39 protein [Isosphaeraceae bacterium]